MMPKSDMEIARELAKLPKKTEQLVARTVQSNLKCGCGNTIEADDIYYIRIEPGEPPEAMCEFCVSMTR